DLGATLRMQHQAGRRLTSTIERLATAASLKDAAARAQLGDAIRGFVRMYRPHAAREDTVLFPALRKVVSGHEYHALGEDFEKKEHELFGADGFEKYVDEVATLEKSVGVDDLGRFTPAWARAGLSGVGRLLRLQGVDQRVRDPRVHEHAVRVRGHADRGGQLLQLRLLVRLERGQGHEAADDVREVPGRRLVRRLSGHGEGDRGVEVAGGGQVLEVGQGHGRDRAPAG